MYGGKTVNETVVAETDDPARPTLTMKISVEVKKFASITPHKIRLRGSYKNEVKGSSIIVLEDEYPFKIKDIKAKKGKDISYDFEMIDYNDKPAYVISVKNEKDEPGKYRDKLFIRTDNRHRPELLIRVSGDITD